MAGTAKGFGHANDAVKRCRRIATKRELALNGDKAYLGVMGEVHMHDAYIDIQTFVNMGFHEEGLCPEEAEYWMDEIAGTMFIKDESAIRDLNAVIVPLAEAVALMNAIPSRAL